MCAASTIALGAGLSLLPGSAEAGCSQSGKTVTCKGNLSGYTSDDFSYSSGVDELIFEDLDEGYEIDGGDTIISLTDTGADGSDDGDDGSAGNDLTITYNPGDDTGFYGYKVVDTGIEVSSQGGDGAEGKGESGTGSTTAGDAGDGADAGSATLTMTSGWYEQKKEDASTGLSVASTGGAGGDGGKAEYSGDSSDDSYLYGGNGGMGGDAGAATLTISDLSSSYTGYGIDLSDVTTGISVVSTGGAGGEGGEAGCDGYNSECKAYSGVGGAGGAGSNAGATITDTDVSISNFSDTGIEVLSTGSDGGAGGLAKALYPVSEVGNTPSNGYGVGGDGGSSGTASLEVSGSTITVTDTTSAAAYGVVVSSTGGDGGRGNESYSNDTDAVSDPDYGVKPGWGNGGDGGNGGSAELTVESASELSVSLSADDAVGVLVSSHGGDGGDVGEKHGLWQDVVFDGADGGDGGYGSPVSLTMDSTSSISVTTTGTGGSMGALTLLSQGGDGGNGGSGSYYGDGNGGAGNYAGRITGTLTTVSATTSGDDAFGIYLATLGGAGGTGASGDGSGGASSTIDVEITSATVTTAGKGAHGIYALSQGGAGGNSSSGGDGGDADWIILKVDGGTINVSGEDAYGVAAISSAGSAGSGSAGDTAGAVTLTIGADVTVSGKDAYGLYGESTGGASNGTIGITVDSGATITASDDATAAVYFVNGDSNTLTNNGTITTDDLTSTSIYAVKASGGALAVTNTGTFAGAVDFDTGYTNSFANESGGTLETGSAFDLGSAGTLTNEGTLSPGGTGTVLASTITAGTFTQSSDGTYLVDVSGNSTDQLLLDTTGATVAGSVEVNVITSPSASGSSIIILSSGGSLDSSGLTVSDTATTDYSLDTSIANYVQLGWTVDMASPGILGSASGNQSKVASHLQSVLESGNSSEDASAEAALSSATSADGSTGGGLGSELSSLLNIVSVDEYLAALDTFSPQVASDTQLTSLFSSQRFSDALLSCSVREGGYRFVDQDNCVWLRIGGSGMDRSASSANRPFEQRAWQFAGGGQIEVGPDWFLGTGFSIETQSLNVDGIADSDGTFYQGGVVAKHTIANSVLSASLTAGYGDFDITRSLFSGDTARGDESLWTVSGQVSASHAFVMNAWYVKPRIDMGFSHVAMNGFTETGAGGASLTIADNEQTYVNLQPALEIGGEIRTANGALWRPKLSVGLTQYLGDAAPSTTASFADTPAGIAPFTTTSEFDRTYLDLGAGLEVLANDRITVSAQGFSQVSQNITSYGGSAKLAIRF